MIQVSDLQEKELWEKIFQELDHNKDWREFCDENLPGGMGEVHDDNLQSFVAQLIASYIEKYEM